MEKGRKDKREEGKLLGKLNYWEKGRMRDWENGKMKERKRGKSVTQRHYMVSGSLALLL